MSEMAMLRHLTGLSTGWRFR